MIDNKDKKILNIIQSDAKTSNAAIGERIGLAPSAVFERNRKLESKGTIKGYHAVLEPKSLGLNTLAFVFLKMRIGEGQAEIDRQIRLIREVQEAYHIAGEDCYLIKIWAKDTDELGRLLLDKVHTIKGVISTRTTIVLQTVKQTTQLPLTGD